VPVGSTPHGLDYAADSGRLYVANEGSGTVSVLAVTDSLVTPVGEIPAGAGTTQVRIDPSGRTGVASNRRANTLTVFDASSGEVVKTVPAGAGPDGIVFLDGYAVVRNSLSPDVTFVNLRNPDIADEIAIGTEPVLAGPRPGVHARPFLNATGDEVLVPSPAAGILQHLHVMMGRPMAMDQTRVGQGTAFLLSLTNEVQEVSPGTYQRMVRFDRAGTYTLRVSLGPDRPQPLAEFALPVVSSSGGAPWLAVAPPGAYIAGQEGVVQYRVTDRRSGAAVEGLRDAVISVYRLAPGQTPWQRVLPAEDAGDGLYQARVVFPEPGTFSATITSRELGLRPEDGARGTVEVVDGG
jgi:DNA-binding beta-propeller fold protein YncE